MTITLTTAASSCAIKPELGGAILRLRVDGRDVLRPAHDTIDDVRDAACFPLVPFANRIAEGRFAVRGERIALRPDPAGGAHALHGHGWRARWEIAAGGGRYAVIGYDHAAGEWPWSYRAEQRLFLDEHGLTIELSVRNLSPATMPAGAGIHPYFTPVATSGIRACSVAIWRNDASGLACERLDDRRFDWRTPLRADELVGMDNFVETTGPSIALEDGDTATIISSTQMAGFHLYQPEGRRFLCIEPTDHRPNAFAPTPPDRYLVPPGAERLWRFRIDAF